MEEPKCYYYLYQITNLVNSKIYVGIHQTKDLDDNYFGSGRSIKQAIKKYGKINFEKIILQMCNSFEEINNLEAEIVNEEFVLRKDTYNIELGGHGGCKHTEETKKKMSEDKMGHPTTEETRRKMSEAQKKRCAEHPAVGRPHSDETKRKISEARMGIKLNLSEEQIKARSERMIGNKYSLGVEQSEESRKKKSEASMGNQYCLGHHPSEETRKKLSESHKGNTANLGRKFSEEWKRKIGEASKGRLLSAESKKKMSDAKKEFWLKRKSQLQISSEVQNDYITL